MVIKHLVRKHIARFVTIKKAANVLESVIMRFFTQEDYVYRLKRSRFLKQRRAVCVLFERMNQLRHSLEYRKLLAGSILQSRLVALFERQRTKAEIVFLKAASTLSRFVKVRSAVSVHERLQRINAGSIIHSHLIALFVKQQSKLKFVLLKAASTLSRFAKVKRAENVHTNLQAASTLSRFAKVQHAKNVRERLQNFVKDLSCYECPLCFEDLSSISIGVIQPCGHIHCKACFDQIGTKCSCCRAKIIQSDCKSVGTFLSKSNPKFFFTRMNPDKKAAINLIGWTIKRRLIAQN
jgi:hypothetical protein